MQIIRWWYNIFHHWCGSPDLDHEQAMQHEWRSRIHCLHYSPSMQNIQYIVSLQSVSLLAQPTVSSIFWEYNVQLHDPRNEEIFVSSLRLPRDLLGDHSWDRLVQSEFRDIIDLLPLPTNYENFCRDRRPTFAITLSKESGALTANPINITCAFV